LYIAVIPDKEFMLKKILNHPRFKLILLFGFFIGSLLIVIYAYRQQQYRGTQRGSAQILDSKTKNILTTEYALIPVNSLSGRTKASITIPFVPPQGQIEVWLSLRLNDDKKQNYLMSHADLNTLNWPSVSNESYTLFQKNKKYNSVEEFLSNLPQDSLIQADPDIITQYFAGNDLIKPLAAKIDFEQLDYILTTFKPFYYQNQWSVFKTTINTSDAFISDDNMYLEFFIKGISDSNPFIFEQVYVDY